MVMRLTLASIVSGLVLLCADGSLAEAGKNQGGALIVHTTDRIYAYRYGPCAYYEPPASCETAGTQANISENNPALIWILATFPSGSDPGVSRVAFGLRHDRPEDWFLRYEPCGPAGTTVETDPGWPHRESAGVIVTFGAPISGSALFPVYGFAVYGGSHAYLGTGPHPRLGSAQFWDDQPNPRIDPCNRFGMVRWYQPGFNRCPGPDAVDLLPRACCFADGRCEDLAPDLCRDQGGFPSAQPIACDANPCQGLGACCLPNGDCAMRTTEDCLASGGKPRGPWHTCWGDVDPPCGPAGACCLPSGLCVVTSDDACVAEGGRFLGEATSCRPSPCVPQACCFFNGTCQATLSWDCVAAGGDPLGAETTCDPNHCPQPGACCFPGGACGLFSKDSCLQQGGVFLGGGTNCDPNPCAPKLETATTSVQTTWGRIKAVFR